MSIEALRRSELIDATVRTIDERGFDRTTVRDIARAAGASPASVLYYFASKDELLAVAFAESDQQFRDRVRRELDGLTGADRLARVVELCFPDQPSDDPAWNVEIDLWSLAARRDDFREIFEAASSEWLDMLLGAVAEELGAEPDEDARDAAMAFAALIDGLAVHARVTQHIDTAAARRILLREVDALRSQSQRNRPTATERT